MLKEIANSIRRDAVGRIECSLDWKEENDPKFESEMKAMFNADTKDMLKIADLVEQNKIKEAADHARHMDTAARECINDHAWDFLMDNSR